MEAMMFVEIIESIENDTEISEKAWHFLEWWASDIIMDFLPDISTEDHLDIMQDCLLGLIKSLPKYDCNRPLSPLYGVIVRNRCLQYERGNKTLEPLPDSLPSKNPGPTDWLDYNCLWEYIPETSRDIAEMLEDGFLVAEIATAKGYTPQNASQQVKKIRERLTDVGYRP
jgi:DNA-directed RNA polymerase specialized sigma24 family protein